MEIASLLKRLRGQTVCLDTMIFIYAFEEHPTYLPFLKTFFLSVEKGEIEAVISTITMTECLVQPYRKKDFALAAQYLIVFRNFPHLSVIPVTDEIAERAAFLRARYNLKTPDAVQLATTLVSGSRFFLTNDADLPSVEGIQILILERLS
jgi:predicted nucleic acid-binding protein